MQNKLLIKYLHSLIFIKLNIFQLNSIYACKFNWCKLFRIKLIYNYSYSRCKYLCLISPRIAIIIDKLNSK